MTRYVALLRGIGPSNPNMRGEKLRGTFESLGFKNVATVIASGNVVFESSSKDVAALESKIEKALPEKLGFKSTTIIRSKEELEAIAKKNPYKKILGDERYYPLITFLKESTPALKTFPKKGEGHGIVGISQRELFGYVDTKGGHAVDYMPMLDKHFSKANTSRTWLTLGRILKQMEK